MHDRGACGTCPTISGYFHVTSARHNRRDRHRDPSRHESAERHTCPAHRACPLSVCNRVKPIKRVSLHCRILQKGAFQTGSSRKVSLHDDKEVRGTARAHRAAPRRDTRSRSIASSTRSHAPMPARHAGRFHAKRPVRPPYLLARSVPVSRHVCLSAARL